MPGATGRRGFAPSAAGGTSSSKPQGSIQPPVSSKWPSANSAQSGLYSAHTSPAGAWEPNSRRFSPRTSRTGRRILSSPGISAGCSDGFCGAKDSPAAIEMLRHPATFLFVVGTLGCALPGLVAAPAPLKISFNEHIQPIISENCYHCHGSDSHSRKAGLRLDREEFAFAPRKDGLVIIRGDP